MKYHCTFFFSFLATQQHMEFPRQGSDPSRSCKARSPTHCARLEVKPAFQHSQDTIDPIVLQWEFLTITDCFHPSNWSCCFYLPNVLDWTSFSITTVTYLLSTWPSLPFLVQSVSKTPVWLYHSSCSLSFKAFHCLQQCYAIELYAMMEVPIFVLSSMVATSHMQLLSTWNVARTNEEMNF